MWLEGEGLWKGYFSRPLSREKKEVMGEKRRGLRRFPNRVQVGLFGEIHSLFGIMPCRLEAAADVKPVQQVNLF